MRKMNEMPYHIALKAKLYLNDRCRHIVAVNDGASRYVYNHLVATNNEIYHLKKINIYLSWLDKRLDYLKSVIEDATAIKNSAPFLYDEDIDSDAIHHAIANYRTAWKNQKERHTGVPTFHKKSYEQSYQTSNHYKKGSENMNDGSIKILDKNHIQLPKMGRVRIGVSHKLMDKILTMSDCSRIGTVTISRDSVSEYWVSITLASEKPFFKKKEKTNSQAGIDLNLDNFLTDSNGNVIDNPRFLKQTEQKLKKAQKRLSRRYESAKKDKRDYRKSKNYQKQRKTAAYLHRKVKRQRDDFQHTLSLWYIKNHDIIAAEDLKVRNMIKNHKLAKAIQDVSWRSFLTKLQYKAEFYDKKVILVNPKNTTQKCSSCGYTLTKEEKLTLADREWVCPKCKTFHHRDHNSAINILNSAIKQIS